MNSKKKLNRLEKQPPNPRGDMSNELKSTSSAERIREYLGNADEVTLSDLIDAVMILCRRVEQLDRAVARTIVNPNA